MPRSDATSYSWYTMPSDYSDPLGLGDDRKCQVADCLKKHAFRRHGNRKVYSRYCADHTCAVMYPEEEGTHCPTPRNPTERYCPGHLRCGEPTCRKMGEYVHKSGEYIRWYCTKHRCSAHDCTARATDSTQKVCAAHLMRCSIPSCSRPAHRHRDGHLDVVCAAHYGTHRCLATGCDRWASARYCAEHRCLVSSCTASRASSPPNAEACLNHLCRAMGCANAVLYPTRNSSAHCALHTCRSPSCSAPRMTESGSDFCASHTCNTPGCRSEVVHSPARYCVRHACVVMGCTNARLSAPTSASGGNSPLLLAPGEDRDRT
ncbi:hypothetical protein VTJ49DRAFT_4699 [Mycothermus thermophilus]|uniref:Uncharacterized protein n=1 Tax=Humicola insolens TaxID=85995 RepID=A0ABR3V4R2_HUMIN